MKSDTISVSESGCVLRIGNNTKEEDFLIRFDNVTKRFADGTEALKECYL